MTCFCFAAHGAPMTPLLLLCSAAGYVLEATVTTRFTARRNQAQHINDRLYAALAGAPH